MIGSHTDLECTCGWSSIACFPKIHAMMNEDALERALEKQDVRAMDAYYELRLWDRKFRYMDYSNRDYINRVYVNHTRRIKYKNTLHTVSRTNIKNQKPYDTKDSQVVPHSILIRPIEA